MVTTESYIFDLGVVGEREVLDAVRAFEKLDKEGLQAAGAIGAVGDESKKTQKQIPKTTSVTQKLTGAMKGMAPVIGAGVAALTAIAAASFVAAREIFQLADFASSFTDDMLVMSKRVGLSTETLIGMKGAAEAVGLELESMTFGLASFVQTLGTANRGGKQAEEKFARLGVAVKDSEGNMREADGVLRDILGSIGKIQSPTEQAAAALDIFGTRGGAIVAAMGEGGEALDEWIEKAKTAGVVIDEDLIAASTALDRAMIGLSTAFDGLKLQMGKDFTPAVVDVVRVFTALTLASTDAFTAVAQGGSVLGQVFSGLVKEHLQPFGDALALLISGMISLKELMGADVKAASFALVQRLEHLDETIREGVSMAVEGLTSDLGDYWDQAGQAITMTDELGESMGVAAEETEKVAEATKHLIAQRKTMLELQKAQIEAREEEAEQLKEDAEAQLELAEEQEAVRRRAAESARDYAVEHRAMAAALRDTVLSGVEGMVASADAILQVTEKAGKKAKRLAKALFRADQVVQIGRAVMAMNTAAIALALPPPVGLGPIAGPVFAYGQGGISIAAIASQKPPSFHTGGVVGSGTGISPPSGSGAGERQITALVGEHYEQPEQRARGGGDVRHVWQVDHRTFEASLRRSRIRGGEMGQATASDGIGQRRRQHG